MRKTTHGRTRVQKAVRKKNRSAAFSTERMHSTYRTPDNVRSASRQRTFVFGLILVAITILAYHPVWNGGFIWDDDLHVTGNVALRSLDGLRRIWFEVGTTAQYYPLVHTMFWLEYRLWGLHPFGFHVDNVLLHALGAILLWRALVRIQESQPGIGQLDEGSRSRHEVQTTEYQLPVLNWPWLAAAIFALHPVNVESVAWVTERKNVLSGVFYFAAALTYLRFAHESGDGNRESGLGKQSSKLKTTSSKLTAGWPWYLASFVLFLCALLSKTIACSLPAALLLILWWKNGKVTINDVLRLLPFLIAGLGMGLLTAHLEKTRVGAQGADWTLSFFDRCLIAGRALWFYASKLVWPTQLTFIYPRWDVNTAVWWQWIFPAATIGVVAALWFLRKEIGLGPLVGALFFAGTLFPALGFINVYPMRYTFVADHYQYVASIGLVALISAGVLAFTDSARFGPRRTFAVAILILGALGILTWRQSATYRDIETLWRTTIDRNPSCWMAETNLGAELLESKGDVDGAIPHLEKSLQLKSDYTETHDDLAYALLRKGDVERATTEAQGALSLQPNEPEAHVVLGMALMTKGRTDEAITHFSKAIEIRPNHSRAHYNLAIAFLETHETGKAIDHYEKAIEAQPDYLEALTNLAWIFASSPDATIRNGPKAVQLAEKANQLTGATNPLVLRTLAAAYASNNSLGQALETSRRALQFAQQERNPEAAEAIRREISFYEAGRQPY